MDVRRVAEWGQGRKQSIQNLIRRTARRLALTVSLLAVVFTGTLAQFAAAGIGVGPVAHAASAGKGGKNTFQPSVDKGGKAVILPGQAHVMKDVPKFDPIRRPRGVTMKPADVALDKAAAARFVSDDKRLEVAVPAGAVTDDLVTTAVGPLHLHVAQLEGPSAGTDSGHIELGTYQFTLMGPKGQVAAALAKDLQVTLHTDQLIKNGGVNFKNATLVVNGSVLADAVSTADGTLPADRKAASARATYDPKAKTLTATIAAASTSGGSSTGTWNTDSPEAQWSKQTDTSVDVATGALSYDYPLDVPTGPGGLTPSLHLGYSSGSVAGAHNPMGTAGWLGEGWDLSVGSISWGEHNVTSTCDINSCPNTCTISNFYTCTTFENSWNFADAYGNSGELIPQDSTIAPWYDDTNAAYKAQAIQWYLSEEHRAKVFSFINPNNIPGQDLRTRFPSANYPNLPPCFRAFLPNGLMEEFGCTLDSLQFYVNTPAATNNLSNYVYRWDLDMVTDASGNQIHFTYNQRLNNYGNGIQFPVDATLASITYDSPNCHNTSAMCTGSNWQPAVQIVFDTDFAPVRLQGAACPTWTLSGYYSNAQTMRCDDAHDLSQATPAGTRAPALQSLVVLNEAKVQVTTTPAAPSWQTLRTYNFTYEQAPSSTQYGTQPVIDPTTGLAESVAGYTDLTQIQEVGDDGQATLPPLSMGYATYDEYYVDTAFTPAAGAPCGPAFNQRTGCPLWAQTYNARYLTSLDNGRGWHEAYTYKLARNNTHGVASGMTLEDPFACTNASASVQAASPCNTADDQNWSRVLLTQRQASVLCVNAAGAGCGSGGANALTSTWSYAYTMNDVTAHECSGCNTDMYWGNQNDGDKLDFYNAHMMGFKYTNVTNPDGSLTAYRQYSTTGYGVATGSITCAAFSGHCDVAPWTDPDNALHGRPAEVDYYDTDGKTLLKQEFASYNVSCPANGDPTSPSNTNASSQYPGQLTSELDINNPVTVCEVTDGQKDTYLDDKGAQSTAGRTTVVPSYSYDGAGHLTQSSATTTANNAGQRIFGTQHLEAEALPYSVSNDGSTATVQGNCCGITLSNNNQIWLSATGPGSYVALTATLAQAATYDFAAMLTKAADRGTYTLSIDGAQVGQPYDGYSGPVELHYQNFGYVTLSAGQHQITLTITGKNASSSGYRAGIDYFEFAPVYGRMHVEAESLMPYAAISNDGSSAVVQGNCCGIVLSGNNQVWLSGTGVGSYVTLNLNSVPAGTYNLGAMLTKAPDRGTYTLAIDGQQVGQPYDGYNSAVLLDWHNFGQVQVGAGPHQITLTITGKNASSSGYRAGVDYFDLTPVGNPGTIEAETLLPGATYSPDGSSASAQTNCCGLQWSNNTQVWFGGTGVGSYMRLPFTVAAGGVYNLSMLLTRSFDFGIYTLSLDGAQVGGAYDAYSGDVLASGPVGYGQVQLAAGQHTLQLTITGKNASSSAYRAGLDAIVLDLAGSPSSVVARTQYAWRDAISVSNTGASGTYFNQMPAVQTTEDAYGNAKACAYLAYDGGAAGATGNVGAIGRGLRTRTDRYSASCQPGALSGQVSTNQIYDASGNTLATQDSDALAGIAGHTDAADCTFNSTAFSACAQFDGLYTVLPTRVTNALGQKTNVSYTTDGANANSPDATNGWGRWLATTTDANGQTTAFAYDPLGRLTATAKPGDTLAAPTTGFAYPITCAATGAAEPCTAVTATQQLASGVTVTSATYYDGWGRAVETVTPQSQGSGTCTFAVAFTTYDPQGNLSFKSDPYFATANQANCQPTYFRPDTSQPGVSTTYDGLGRVISQKDPLLNPTTTTYTQGSPQGANVTDTATYEATTVVDANHHQAVTLTDGYGHSRFTEHFTGGGPYNLYSTSATNYDVAGDVTSVFGANASAAGLSTTYQTTTAYDLLGRATATSDADLGAYTFAYDPNGNLTQSVDPRGASGTVYAGYDGLNRQLWRNTTNSSNGAYAAYTYDGTANGNKGVGRLTGETFNTGANLGAGSYAYTYDARGQRTGQTIQLNATSYTFAFSYNDAGQPTSLTYSDGAVLSFGYSALDWLTSASAMPSGGAQVNLFTNIGYAGVGGAAMRPTGASMANGTYTFTTTYDNDVRLTASQIAIAGGGATRYAFLRTFDAAGNVTGVGTTLAAGTDTQAFCYDEQNRLTWASAAGGAIPCGGTNTAGSLTAAGYTQSFAYDALDRLTSSPLGGYAYNDPAHLHAATAAGSGYTATHDVAGDMVCRAPTNAAACTPTTSGGAKLTYDAERRLVGWQDKPTNPTSSASFAYDGEGNRVAASVNGTTTYYLGALEEVAGATLTKYYAVPGLPIAVDVGGTLSYLASEGQGSNSEALDGAGNVTAQQLYAPYGGARYGSGAMPTTKGFTGQRADAASGLDYFNARYYDPALGQFATADSVGDGLNRYGYVRGNPETATDPTGHMLVATDGSGGDPYYDDDHHVRANPEGKPGSVSVTTHGAVVGPGKKQDPASPLDVGNKPDTFTWGDADHYAVALRYWGNALYQLIQADKAALAEKESGVGQTFLRDSLFKLIFGVIGAGLGAGVGAVPGAILGALIGGIAGAFVDWVTNTSKADLQAAIDGLTVAYNSHHDVWYVSALFQGHYSNFSQTVGGRDFISAYGDAPPEVLLKVGAIMRQDCAGFAQIQHPWGNSPGVEAGQDSTYSAPAGPAGCAG